MLSYLLVAAGGLIGAPSRYLLDRLVTRRITAGTLPWGTLPWGTLLINVSGALLLGFLTGLTLAGRLPAAVKTGVGTGFCGAYTTYSTFTVETMQLAGNGQLAAAAGNVAVSLVAGLAAAALGVALGLAA
jgi:CrcB protein